MDYNSGCQFSADTLVIVPDNIAVIQSVVKGWTIGSLYDWVITTGGTGFGPRDLTPEAIAPLIERPAPGLIHLIMSESLKHTPLAALSRPVAGSIRNTLITTLPGSPKAVKENLSALLQGGVVSHALDLLTGGKESGQVHTKLGVPERTSGTAGTSPGTHLHPHGHHHHHHHHHEHHKHGHQIPVPRTLSHDPDLPVSQRNRVSPYPLISMDEAIKLVLQVSEPLESVGLEVNSRLAGHVLSEDVMAPHELPASPTTNVDGYAVKVPYKKGVFKVLTPATLKLGSEVPTGSVYRINTGAPLPSGTNAVIMVEDTRVGSQFSAEEGQEGEEKTVELLAEVDVGENVRKSGSDVRIGDRVLAAGDVVSGLGGEVGALAFVGRKQVQVYRKPVVALLSTGNELVDLQEQSSQIETSEGWSGVVDTNRPSLKAALEGLGYEVIDMGIAHDNIDAHISALSDGISRADILVTTGGTSMGASDLLKPLLERNLKGVIHFGRVAMKPGKPTTFASVPATNGGRDKLVFGLPGNPASALVTFYLFVLPALRRLGGWAPEAAELPRVPVELTESLPLDPRPEFHRVHVRVTASGLKAFSTGGQRSSRVASLAGANGLVALPALVEDGPKVLEKGQIAKQNVTEFSTTRQGISGLIILSCATAPEAYNQCDGARVSINRLFPVNHKPAMSAVKIDWGKVENPTFAFQQFPSRRSVVYGRKGVVSCTQPLAAEAGLEILRKGGNAADAAVAVSAALNATEPTSCGIGGDAFCLFYDASKKTVQALNGSGRSPKALNINVARKNGAIGRQLTERDLNSVTVPGAAAAWVDTVARFGSGKVSFEEVMTPAIRLAEEGVPISELTANGWKRSEGLIKSASPSADSMLINGRAPLPGEVMRLPDLAQTFRTLVSEGKRGFYTGRIAEAIVELIKSKGGVMELSDLAEHNTEFVEPIKYTYAGEVTLWECPPNGQGLTALMALGILEAAEETGKIKPLLEMDHNSVEYLHALIEALRLAFADTQFYVSDPKVTKVPVEEMLSKEYLKRRAEKFNANASIPDVYHGNPTASTDTVYFSVTDQWGNGCSYIQSNYAGFGTGGKNTCNVRGPLLPDTILEAIPKGCGFTLQNRGSGFVLEEGHPNQLAGGKRPYHTIIPALATRGDELFLVYGVMGGFMQPQGHIQVLLNILRGFTPQAALDAPRFCISAGSPDASVANATNAGDINSEVYFEDGIPVETVEKLKEMGHDAHRLSGFSRAMMGRGQVIQKLSVKELVWAAGSDQRGDGHAIAQI
ncbi:gamma-glutamyltranspeptidase [Rhizoctonia solani]|uniref:Gamma-glutamyltranspeptidase n=1 Tax=Rhizoctonia solani TaxID=456999 RepID=A0A8H8ST29_9AGAM|nr:gamma-glutamyltranspeptidase [Rhizoctonia solani]QRW15852.1 gamma-glutamyltranspeptidase [Rhizoctonia solani]